ncbi:MAG TPA: cache domain-containing protein [Ignavibacteriales bacterium]|nr:cache domain-containing protein [Ignavibacteriales bacterium]HOL80872.1 cache domain-containing protein [Ignavibacteriales bacterium]HOM65898.1 cache domain-containing protein [Ignavibacteriales bacterium]HPD67654.1 cache domain-containing protein [Ignavibacteriales bacterium]HPP33307.1 cache domain-containing protein [Ignavibacteriales bacterium]
MYYNDRKEYLEHLVDVPYTILEYYNKNVQSGEMTLDSAREIAYDKINSLRYNTKEYYFGYKLDGTTEILGSDPSKRGTNRIDLKDLEGKYFIKELCDSARERGRGFVAYMYPKLGEDKPLPKLSFIKYFEPWGIFIGTGIYIDDLEVKISETKQA